MNKECVCGLLLIFCFSFCFLEAHAPEVEWSKIYDIPPAGMYARSIIEVDSGFVIAGSADHGFTHDFFILIADESGNELWYETHGHGATMQNIGWDRSVQQTSDGGYIVVGAHWGSDNDVYLVKTDAYGQRIWQRLFFPTSDEEGVSVVHTADGAHVIGGNRGPYASQDFLIMKVDAFGDTVWTNTVGSDSTEIGMCLQPTHDNGYIMAGYTRSCPDQDIYLVKFDSLGDTVWTKTYGDTAWDYVYSVQQTADNGFVFVGETWPFGSIDSDLIIMRSDSLGDTLWTRTYGGGYWDGGYSVDLISDGGYIIAGYTQSFSSAGTDMWLVRTDSIGDTLWTMVFGGDSADEAYSVIHTSDGGYALAGYTRSFTSFGKIRAYVIKTYSDLPVQENTQRTAETHSISVTPNPFSHSTFIRCELGNTYEGAALLVIYDINGRCVKSFDPMPQASGALHFRWDGTDDANHQLPSGVYIAARFIDGVIHEKKKLMLIR